MNKAVVHKSEFVLDSNMVMIANISFIRKLQTTCFLSGFFSYYSDKDTILAVCEWKAKLSKKRNKDTFSVNQQDLPFNLKLKPGLRYVRKMWKTESCHHNTFWHNCRIQHARALWWGVYLNGVHRAFHAGLTWWISKQPAYIKTKVSTILQTSIQWWEAASKLALL